ncbi:hypothetical protein CC79DRAFT_1373895 [Sarocladium strictum]
MAILPEFPDLEVRVKIEGELAPDYENKDANRDHERALGYPTGHFYVEAKTGARYCVQVDVTKPFFAHLASHCGEATCAQLCLSVDDFLPETMSSQVQGLVGVRDFVFSAIQMKEDTDEQTTYPQPMDLLHFGNINIAIWVGVSSQIISAANVPKVRMPGELLLAEKDPKKLDVTHRSMTSAESTTTEQGSAFLQHPKCLGSLTFAYRSREMLQNLLVIPRPEVPEVEPEIPHFAAMSHEEFVALATRHWPASQRVKAEETSSESSTEVKIEHNDGGATNGVPAGGQRMRVEVDLTQD